MNIITKTALANFRKNKSRNILIGFAIALTAMLLTVVPTVAFGMLDVQFAAVNKLYPTFHGMYREVPEQTLQQLKKDKQLKSVGERQDPGMIVGQDSKVSISMTALDQTTVRLNRIKLAAGEFPEKADEIVVSKGLLKELGLTGAIGDQVKIPFQLFEEGGLGITQEREFTITGLTKDSKISKEKKLYSAMVSKAFVKETVDVKQRNYRVYFQINASKRTSTEELEATMQKIADKYGITENNVVDNAEYLTANYVDPSMNSILAGIMIIVILAGTLTIYSIYYVSMMHKVQEFGKLRAIGATKKQIRMLILREGFAVAGIAIPIGLVIGTLTGIFVLSSMTKATATTDNMMGQEMTNQIKEMGISLVHPWILALAAAVALFTVFISLFRPMQIASRISAVEALRYQGDKAGKKRRKKNSRQGKRKGYAEMNIRKLTASNLGRNRKRTVITIATLGVTGILFMVIATLISCMNPKVITAETIRGDVQISINSSDGDKMHPERELNNIRQNNPLNNKFEQQISDISGVEKIEKQLYVQADLEKIKMNGEKYNGGIGSADESIIKQIKKYVTSGDLTDKRLYDGTGIILSGGYIQKFSSLKVGDRIELSIMDGNNTINKEFTIVAAVDAPGSLAGSSFTLPTKVLQEMCKSDLTFQYSVYIDAKQLNTGVKEIQTLVDGNEFLDMTTYEEQFKLSETGINFMVYGCYGMLFVFGLIGILNLINTMINSVYVRRRELGVLQAIGLSGKQTIHMLQLEGLFYTAGTLILSLGIGSIAGYGVFHAAKVEGIMSIRTYVFPVVPAVVLIIVVAVVQLLVTYLVNQNFKKQSLIDRVRYSD